jgi:hypothetical protein
LLHCEMAHVREWPREMHPNKNARHKFSQPLENMISKEFC